MDCFFTWSGNRSGGLAVISYKYACTGVVDPFSISVSKIQMIMQSLSGATAVPPTSH